MPDVLPDPDSVSTYLNTETGVLEIYPKVDKVRYEATEKFTKNRCRLDGDTLREKLRLSWLNAME